jgi:hypothetical protein
MAKRLSLLIACVAVCSGLARPAVRQQTADKSGALAAAEQRRYSLTVLPPEHKVMKDPITGADLLFVTTHPAVDRSLYFHERSWLADSSMLLFYSQRPGGGLMGYLFATGELVRFATPEGGMGGATAARSKNSVYGIRGRDVIELSLKVEPSDDPRSRPSKVSATERVICRMPEGIGVGQVNENCDGTLLAGYSGPSIVVIDIQSGKLRELWRGDHAGHVQFSRTNPHLLSFAGMPGEVRRLMVIDVREGKPRNIYKQAKGELVTHECWWVKDTLTFCGGHRDQESHVKVIDVHTGEVRIIGAGAWVPWRDGTEPAGSTPVDLFAHWNWWHAAGDENGRWVAADNFYGDIVLFDAHTTQMHRLTLGHRIRRKPVHPEVGWDRRSKQVVFSSMMLGDSDVCVATIPDTWPPDPADEALILTSHGLVRARDQEKAGK